MYIAFKWLVSMTFAMWIVMCGIDHYITKIVDIRKEDNYTNLFGYFYKNITIKHKMETLNDKYSSQRQQGVAVFHFFIFLSGALAVSVFNRKNEIISFTRRNIPKMNVNVAIIRIRNITNTVYFKTTAKIWSIANALKLKETCNDTLEETYRFINYLCVLIKRRKSENSSNNNFLLLHKLKEIGEQRKNLGHLLIAAIHENKNIRMHYQLENMAKNRLVRHIESTQKEMKENRSRYVSFQQLYLVTHQENAYLKSRIRKLSKDKEEAEKNLMELLNEVYKSKNNELKAFCSRFIVRTKGNLLNSDVGAEIQKFLQKSQRPVPSTSRFLFSDVHQNYPKCWPTRVTEIMQGTNNLAPLLSEAPKLKGLPGEYVWTVKDKDGIIEKLYEYDYESNINDDTLKRIRQYSVYYDKDCLLDFSKSRTVISEVDTEPFREKNVFCNVDYPLTSERFLTGSEAFKKFLRSNKHVVSTRTSRAPAPTLLRD